MQQGGNSVCHKSCCKETIDAATNLPQAKLSYFYLNWTWSWAGELYTNARDKTECQTSIATNSSHRFELQHLCY